MRVPLLKATVPNKRDLLQFVDFLDSLGVAVWTSVDSKVARNYLSLRRKEGDKATTIARKLSTLRKFFFWLKKEGIIITNPFAALKPPKKEKTNCLRWSNQSFNTSNK